MEVVNDSVYTSEGYEYLSPPDIADLENIEAIQATSQWMAHTNAFAAGAISTNANSTIGRGFKLRSTINRDYLGLSEEEAHQKKQEIERLFNMWASSPKTDATGHTNFKQLPMLLYKTSLVTGASIALYPETDDGWLQVKILSSTQINREKGLNGIEFKDGAPVAYHIYKKRKELYEDAKSVKIKMYSGLKRNVVHYFDKKIAGQIDGIPYLSAVFDTLRKIKDYSQAELDAAMLSALFAVGIVKKDAGGVSLKMPDDNTIKLKKGNMFKLPAGYEVSTIDPSHPNSSYPEAMSAFITELCIGLDIPKEVFTKEFKASYSASRGAVIEGRKSFRVSRSGVEIQFLSETYKNFLLWSVLNNYLVLDGFLDDEFARMAWSSADWIGDIDEELDPLKAANAAQKRVDGYFTTGDFESKQMYGLDYDDNIERRNSELSKINTKEIDEQG